MPLTSGQKLGSYEIRAKLGEGGMGEVYRARDSKLKRDVAIKVLPADVAGDRERLARFQREAEVLASLNHPHIAHVYGIEDNGLVMELVEGEDLAQRIAHGAIPRDEALSIAKQIAEALEAAHDAGIIHRDLKPANIKVRDDGTVKVLDFGLAKALDVEPKGSTPQETITSPAMTMRGVILGTAAYMAPEQAKGKPVDRRADIWAFGCVLFEMLTGKRTFKGDDVTDIITSVMRDAPDWTALPPDTPLSIRVMLRRCLEKDPRKRAPHMAVARMAIDDALMPTDQLIPGITLHPEVTPKKHRMSLAVPIAAVIAVLGTGVAGWKLRPSPDAPPVVRFQVPTAAYAVQWANFNRQLLAISPDGSQIVFGADRLYLRNVSDSEARPVPGSEGFQSVTHPAFSPDGKSIVFWAASDRTVKRVTLGTNAVSTVCPLAEGGYALSWSSDGNLYIADNGTGIKRVSAKGGQPEVIIPVADREEFYGPRLLPDGDSLLFTLGVRNMTNWDQATIVVQSLRTKVRKVVLQNASDAFYVKTGHLLFGRAGVLYAVPFDLKQLSVIGEPIAVVEGVRRAAPGTTGAVQVAVSDAGTLAYIAGPVSTNGAPLQIAIFDHAGNSEPLNIPQGSYSDPRVSPDGSRVAMTVNDGKESQVWVYGIAKNSAARRLTFGGDNAFAEWSHDGQRVAFQSTREGDAAIWWQKADGSDTATRLTRPAADIAHVPQSFSPNDQHLLFDEIKNGVVTLMDWSMPASKAGTVSGVTTDVPTDATFSPDGRWFAYTIRPPTAQSIVYVEPYPPTGARYQLSLPGEDGHHPAWSRDGKALYYTAGQAIAFT